MMKGFNITKEQWQLAFVIATLSGATVSILIGVLGFIFTLPVVDLQPHGVYLMSISFFGAICLGIGFSTKPKSFRLLFKSGDKPDLPK